MDRPKGAEPGTVCYETCQLSQTAQSAAIHFPWPNRPLGLMLGHNFPSQSLTPCLAAKSVRMISFAQGAIRNRPNGVFEATLHTRHGTHRYAAHSTAGSAIAAVIR